MNLWNIFKNNFQCSVQGCKNSKITLKSIETPTICIQFTSIFNIDFEFLHLHWRLKVIFEKYAKNSSYFNSCKIHDTIMDKLMHMWTVYIAIVLLFYFTQRKNVFVFVSHIHSDNKCSGNVQHFAIYVYFCLNKKDLG